MSANRGLSTTRYLGFLVKCLHFPPRSFQHQVQKDDLEGKTKLVLMTLGAAFPQHMEQKLLPHKRTHTKTPLKTIHRLSSKNLIIYISLCLQCGRGDTPRQVSLSAHRRPWGARAQSEGPLAPLRGAGRGRRVTSRAAALATHGVLLGNRVPLPKEAVLFRDQSG